MSSYAEGTTGQSVGAPGGLFTGSELPNEFQSQSPFYGPPNRQPSSSNHISQAGTEGDQSGAGASSTTLQSTPRDQQFQFNLSKQVEAILKRFREGDIEKGDASLEVFKILSLQTGDDLAKELAIKEYLSSLDGIQREIEASGRRGNRANQVESGIFFGPPERPVTHSPARGSQASREFNEFLDQADASVRRHERSVSPDENLEGERKKCRLTNLDLPWFKKEAIAQQVQRPQCKITQEVLERFSRDPQFVKRSLLTSCSAPPGFPEWDAIIRGTAVNLNTVFSSIQSVVPPKEESSSVGDTEIRFTRPEPPRKILTSQDWSVAWRFTVEAYTHIFEERTAELNAWGKHIEGMFASIQTTFHGRIILFDIAVRNIVCGGQQNILTDTHLFINLWTSIGTPMGRLVGSDGSKKGSASGSKSGSGGSNRFELCNRFNASDRVCTSSAGKCRFIHQCRKCGSKDHGAGKCFQERGGPKHEA
ncbi:hypothetical protein D9615_005937 [Tricholomella constricta]|uniref:C3H1-type domain-containing protein n=1 Tax=Tricholomella constricta TaxID=117010 RepID=A0A8H5H9D3_9AGAR|nr:hypothetical protein D9615_005937 [Tricholomella constricta]